ncbi:FeoB-associated Cys-rich membrane protein [Moheibacter sediminis]|uniref:Virus attachment protein p12 family protein n=1 Tax=Moheibacter sediminis TaxID=1434700 RepID=A0A1W2BI62_9FLAO|nr:FeoB-associated Cys-rich membrane protein [Moheibacter sediminis]SMC72639.1 hypothetical protein SAMN06296427_106196 [Moheibacter sediminis]
MFWTIIQYVFIAVVFIIAVLYMTGMFRKSFGSKNKSCSKGCGCDTPADKKE